MALKTNKNYFWSNSFVDPKRKSRFSVEFGGEFDRLTKSKYPWIVKSINRPKFQVGYDTDSYANQFTGDIGVALPTSWTWQEITVKFVNPYSNTLAPEVGQDLDDILTGYTSARISYARSPSVDGNLSSNKGFFEDQVADPVSERYLGSTIKIYDLSMGYETRQIASRLNKNPLAAEAPPNYNLNRGEVFFGGMYANGYWLLQHPWITKVDFGDHDYSSDDLIEISLSFKYKRANYYPQYNKTLGDGTELPEGQQQFLSDIDKFNRSGIPVTEDAWSDKAAAERSRQIEEERRRAATPKPKSRPNPKPNNEQVATPPPAPPPKPAEPPQAKASGSVKIPRCTLTLVEQKQVLNGEKTKDEICKAKGK
jgi:hypothetical protein